MNTPTIISNMEALTDWTQPGNVGDSGGGSPKLPGIGLWSSGSPAVVSWKPAYAYNNAYFLRTARAAGAANAMTYFEYRLRFMFPTAADIAAHQAFEFELQQNVGSRIYNMAWQRRPKDYWYSFNYNTSTWESSGIASGQLNPGQWVDVSANFLRGGDSTLTHLALRVDGTTTPVNVTREATAKAESNYLNAALQLDGNASAAPYECMVLDMGITMLATAP